MYRKFFYKSLILFSFLYKIVASEEPCIYVEGEDPYMQRQLSDNAELKTMLRELKLQIEESQEVNESKSKDLPMIDTRLHELPEKCQQNSLPKDCAEATACTHRSGIYKIQVPNYNEPFYVECDAKTDGGDWILIQRRQDGSVDFYRPWADYQTGFGYVDGEFFIGLDKLYALTNNNWQQELMIVMENVNLTTAFAKYDGFAIGNATDQYKLKKLGHYSGTAGDSLQYSVGSSFTTIDRKNDKHVTNCAVLFKGAWWHNTCHLSNLNGQYGNKVFGEGVNWKTFSTYTESLKYVKMMIRPRRV